MAVATAFSPQMAAITGNTGGVVQNLPNVTTVGARVRVFHADITLAAQANGTTIGIARLPLGAIITEINYLTDTTLGTATVALGDSNAAAIYAAAQTLTTVNVPQSVGLPATRGVPIQTGYDCVTGLANRSYEDVTLTVGAAALPGAGNLKVTLYYSID